MIVLNSKGYIISTLFANHISSPASPNHPERRNPLRRRGSLPWDSGTSGSVASESEVPSAGPIRVQFIRAGPLAQKTAGLIEKETLKKRITNIE